MGCGSSKGKRQDEKDSAQKDTKGEGTEQDKQDTEGSGQDSPPSLKLQKKREPSAAKEESTPLSLKFKLVGPKKLVKPVYLFAGVKINFMMTKCHIKREGKRL